MDFETRVSVNRTPVEGLSTDPAFAARSRPCRASAMAGDVRDVSVVMADLRGFTAFCEQAPLLRMCRVLNQYLAAMVDVILRHQGRVQDFVGDGILGVFGAPETDPDHAWHAALSALEMQASIRRLGSRWARAGTAAFELGVAVHSGRVFAGAVGCPRQTKYAVVGDPVNTVARLEELNRTLGTKVVMSGDTLARLLDRVTVLPRGSFPVRGRCNHVEVFELLGVRGLAAACAADAPPSLARAGEPPVESINLQEAERSAS